MCLIIEREKAKTGTNIPRVLKAIDLEIWDLVSEIRNRLFDDIPFPDAMYDYVAVQQSSVTTSVDVPRIVREPLPDSKDHQLDKLLDQLDTG